jgi:hypothetical protein
VARRITAKAERNGIKNEANDGVLLNFEKWYSGDL